MSRPAEKIRHFFLIGLCLAVSILAYSRVFEFGLVDYDDPMYVGHNVHVRTGLTPRNLAWAFTSVYAANWHPLTWLSLQLDASLYGEHYWGFHLTNVLLHCAAVVLLYLALKRMTGAPWCSALVAILFSVHPTRVESVAWISERKDVLGAAFWMLTLFLYARYVEKPGAKRRGAVIASFAVGLLAKPMLVTLPAVLCLIDFWPLERVRFDASDLKARWRRLLGEKAPLFALSILVCAATVVAQHRGGAIRELDAIPFVLRMKLALAAYCTYLGQLFVPVDLLAFYPITEVSSLSACIAAIFLLGVTTVAVSAARRAPYLLVGWLWYLGALVPVIGLVQVGDQARADRYTYLPFVGLFIAGVWLVRDLARRQGRWSWAIPVLCGVLVGILVLTTRRQTEYWRDSETLWSHTLEHRPDCVFAALNLGTTYFETDRSSDAERVWLRGLGATEACREKPRCRFSRGALQQNLGVLYVSRGNYDEAVRHLSEATALIPDDLSIRVNLVFGLLAQKDFKGALAQLLYALDHGFVPPAPAVWLQVGEDLISHGFIEEAFELYERLSISFAGAGRFADALRPAYRAMDLARAARPERIPATLGAATRLEGRLKEKR